MNKFKGKIGLFAGSVAPRPRDWDESFDILRALQGSDACGTNSLAESCPGVLAYLVSGISTSRGMRHRPHRRIDDGE